MLNDTSPDLEQKDQHERLFDRDQIVAEVKALVESLNFPPNSFVIFGSGPLAAADIRPAKDIDMLVSIEVFNLLKNNGWKERNKGPGDTPLTSGIFEAHDNWNFSPYSPTLENLLSSAEVIDGMPFASLEEVKKWKLASGGAKHLADVAAIDRHLEKTDSSI